MKSRLTLLAAALAVLAGPATMNAISIAYTFDCDTIDFSDYSSFTFTNRMSSGCMGPESDEPKTFTMEFRCEEQPTYYFDLNCDYETPPPTNNVPDSASSLGLLGATLLGFMAVRRRLTGTR